MKTKINFKILLALGIVLVGMLVFNMNTVKATEVTEEYLQGIIDKIPNTMNLDIPEIEFQKVDNIILSNIESILKKENIEYEKDYYSFKLKNLTINNENIEIGIDKPSAIYLINDRSDFTSVIVEINKYYSNSYKKKEVKIVYNDSKKYNMSDEQYVKNLKLTSPKYFEVEFGKEFNWNVLLKIEEEYYSKQIADNSIIVKADLGAGDGEILNAYTCEGGTDIAIFKDGILYDIRRMGVEIFVPAITVPNTIKENELDNYILNLVRPIYEANEWYKGYAQNGKGILSIIKGTENNLWNDEKFDVDIPNGYTICVDGEANSYIIIKREKENDETISITTTDNKTEVKLDTTTNVVPKDTVLEVEKIEKGDTYNKVNETLGKDINKFVTYDITLKSNGVKVQPNGKVKISIPIPNDFDKTKTSVYRIEDNGTSVKYDTIIEGNYAIIETDHFSTYIVAENNNTTTSTRPTSNSNKLDDTPKTGSIMEIESIISLVAVILVAVIIILKRK